ncbi:extracellular solute-binding protein [Demequina sp. NBRC 110055]|uniref:extracellular solute-binding protein n=1 Tax=Demequina sp. NBRC 110055 TaxID=1570344 RepID=UPI0009FC1430|nr:extracellular solute-binding protein [Demequina sp. NBRC 110055]
MTKMSRRRGFIAAGIGSGLLATTALAGCSGDAAEESKYFDADGNLTMLDIMVEFYTDAAPDPEGDLHQALEELAGVDLDITWVPNSNYADKVATTLASGDIPAVMAVPQKTSAFVQNAEAGGFWDITDQIADYPNLQPYDDDVFANTLVNGVSYGIMRWRDPMRTTVTYRADWLENLGLEVPETVEDLWAVSEAFTHDDPDGNGEDDTYGLIFSNWSDLNTGTPFDALQTWYGAPNGWGVIDGTVTPDVVTDQFLEANTALREAYADGQVNQDFPTLDSANWNDPFFNGQGGIIIGSGSTAKGLLGLFKESDPDNYGDYVTISGSLAAADGELHALPTTGSDGVMAISKSAITTEEQLDKVLEVLDKLNSEEAQRLMVNGIEGVSYEVVDGFSQPITDTPEGETMNADTSAFGLVNMAQNGRKFYVKAPDGEADKALVSEQIDIMAHDLDYAVPNVGLAYVTPTQADKQTQLANIIIDARTKYVVGQIDEAGFRAEIQRWLDEGGQQIVDELNEAYSADH